MTTKPHGRRSPQSVVLMLLKIHLFIAKERLGLGVAALRTQAPDPKLHGCWFPGAHSDALNNLERFQKWADKTPAAPAAFRAWLAGVYFNQIA